MTTQVATARFSVESVHSPDGTVISYRSVGSGGPALLVVPGALSVAEEFDGVAAELARHFTVHTIERRGRGASGPQGAGYGVDAECADIEAVRAATGARLVFAHSFGAFVTLESALRGSAFDGIALYEPGVSIDGSVPMGWAPEAERLLAQGKGAEAFLTFVRGINPDTSGKAPRWLLRIILRFVMKKPERLRKHALLGGAIREHAEAARLDNEYPKYAGLAAPVLLMVGKDETTTGAGRATVRLAEVFTTSELVRFPKLDHFGYEKDPAGVAGAVSTFLRGGGRPAAQ
ncbi:alpha/beta hydrolase [Kitasatospora sp. NPDC050463]|uniref:alpha/beta fold hydrolase n=1 Tax=Kitasatospora sp. NPDC050463 TaxID=3155786 RepID=UPI0033E04688